MKKTLVVLIFLATLTSVVAAPIEDWLQWGGPTRDFKTKIKGLPTTWPKDGPPKLWERPLGEGYSSIIVEGNTLYTMYRVADKETVIALDARTGKTLWEFTFDSPTGKMVVETGPGPHATPLIVGDRLFAAGSTSKVHCLNKKDGTVIWSHDLYNDFNMSFRNRGYSVSPLAYADNIVLTAAGPKGQGLIAFKQSDGSVAWKGGDFEQSYAAPILIKVDGQDQIVAFMGYDIAGWDAKTGTPLWRHPFPNNTDNGLTISTPVYVDGVLYASCAYDGGIRALRLKREGNTTKVEELWFHKQMRVHFSTLMYLGDMIFGSSGDFGPSFFTALNRHTGEVMWRDRSYAKASFLWVDGKLLLLDEDGDLAWVSVTPEGLVTHARAKVSEGTSWTVPTLVGTKAYIRNKKTIMAVELGSQAATPTAEAQK